MSEDLDKLTVSELNDLAEKLHLEIMDLYDQEESEETYQLIEDKTRYFNEVKSLIRDLHWDETYPTCG